MEIKNKIVLGDVYDVLKTLEDNTFDMGVTSPPYNKQKNRKGVLVKDIKYSDITDNKNESEYQIEQIEILNELFRVIKHGGSFFYNHKVRWDKGEMFHPMDWVKKTDWTIKQEIIWDRQIAANIRGWRFWQVEERIYWLYKPLNNKDNGEELKSKHALMTSVWRLRPEMTKATVFNHPAPFPIEIPTRCIYSILDDKKECNIIDPYMGSGTSAVVSKLLGHNYFGIDISEEYITNANYRINNITDKEISDFNDEVTKHKVNKTYKDRKKEKNITKVL
jgi:site-specific DNA-methyltransferase (adenine-specific)